MDLLTASFLIGLMSGLAGGVTVLFLMLAPRYRGVILWAFGNLLTAGGYILFLLREVVPVLLSSVIANAFVILALYILLVGTAMFVGRERQFKVTRGVLVVAFFAFLFFTFALDRPEARMLLVGLSSAVVAVQIANLMFSSSTPSLRFSYWFGGILFSLYTLISIVHPILFLVSDPPRAFLSSSQGQTAAFALEAIFIPFWSAAAVAMIVQRLSAELALTATIDYLTQTLNRRGGEVRIRQEAARAKRSAKPFSILLLDVDKFKQINDRYGHYTGDAAVQFVAKLVRDVVREEDIVCRWGGDEFLVLLVGSSREDAIYVAERLRSTVAARACKTDAGSIRCTVSIGLAWFDASGSSVQEIIASADAAMYHSKQLGGNRVTAG